jgi:hypothetical protein
VVIGALGSSLASATWEQQMIRQAFQVLFRGILLAVRFSAVQSWVPVALPSDIIRDRPRPAA